MFPKVIIQDGDDSSYQLKSRLSRPIGCAIMPTLIVDCVYQGTGLIGRHQPSVKQRHWQATPAATLPRGHHWVNPFMTFITTSLHHINIEIIFQGMHGDIIANEKNLAPNNCTCHLYQILPRHQDHVPISLYGDYRPHSRTNIIRNVSTATSIVPGCIAV